MSHISMSKLSISQLQLEKAFLSCLQAVGKQRPKKSC